MVQAKYTRLNLETSKEFNNKVIVNELEIIKGGIHGVERQAYMNMHAKWVYSLWKIFMQRQCSIICLSTHAVNDYPESYTIGRIASNIERPY